MKSTVLKFIVPVLIIALSGLAYWLIASTKSPPPKVRKEPVGALVRTMRIEAEDKNVTVRGHGTVQPRMEANIVPQVSGKVVRVAPQFVVGGMFQEGEPLFEIEKIDYELAVEMAGADFKKAEFELAKVESDARVARTQWEKWSNRKTQAGNPLNELLLQPSPLVLYGPQLENARAQVAAARAALDKAQLDLDRTCVKAPFTSMIRTESVDAGQYVRAGESVGQMFGTDVLEIVVPLSFQEMTWLEVPFGAEKTNQAGINAEVRLRVGERVYTWPGRVHRSLGEVDARGRMIKVVVQVEHPYDNSRPQNGTNLALGMFVEVFLHGKKLENVIVIPRSALRDNQTVWLVGETGRLHIQPVQYAWATDEEVWISSGLQGGENVVLTSLGGAVEGMKLRIAGTETPLHTRGKGQNNGGGNE
ncbi:MAG: efflux RND transporter periplasmic adaptor subunit [Deltaproteobacteria bacterium]|nr:efflux RND transporter periplasmic adaptor subunit [Deltaproteobacteria bacterium]